MALIFGMVGFVLIVTSTIAIVVGAIKYVFRHLNED